MTEPPSALATLLDIAIIRKHLEIAEVSKRTQALMPSIVNFKDALSRLTTLETELATLRANAPQPIDTAPRDGTRFWGMIEDDAIAMMWHHKFEAFVSSWRRMTMAPGYTFNDEAVHDHSPTIHEPKFWMPIAKMPTAALDDAVERIKPAGQPRTDASCARTAP